MVFCILSRQPIGRWSVNIEAYLENLETELTPNGETIHYATGSDFCKCKSETK
jgi:hypothetical protein